MSDFLRELRAARAAREARIELRASARVTTALEAAVDAASTLESAETIAGRADGRNPGVGPGVEHVEPDLLPSSARRRRRGGDLLSDEALRRIVDRIHAQHVEESDANARLRAAIRGLEPNEFASLPDDTWPGLDREDGAARSDECAVCYVGFEDGDALKVLPCGHSQFHLLSFAKRLAQRFPSWQFVLVDLRCHGQTANMPTPPAGANDVTNAAKDVLATLQHLKIYPHSLIGHSFGGKVAMSMVHQFGKQLPRPVQVWVLDTVPGDVWCEAGDHPRDTIAYARTIPMPIANRKALVDSLTGAGFTLEGAQWMTTNLTPAPGATAGELTWVFDIEGIVAMYQSYEATDLWPMLETQPVGLSVDFVRAERSAFVWADEDVGRIGAYGGRVHYLANSSHWVHIDNPDGLLEILAPSFERKK